MCLQLIISCRAFIKAQIIETQKGKQRLQLSFCATFMNHQVTELVIDFYTNSKTQGPGSAKDKLKAPEFLNLSTD
jgi:hypothetical protein